MNSKSYWGTTGLTARQPRVPWQNSSPKNSRSTSSHCISLWRILSSSIDCFWLKVWSTLLDDEVHTCFHPFRFLCGATSWMKAFWELWWILVTVDVAHMIEYGWPFSSPLWLSSGWRRGPVDMVPDGTYPRLYYLAALDVGDLHQPFWDVYDIDTKIQTQ